MRLATFNLENLFTRPEAMIKEGWSEGRAVLNDIQRLQELIALDSYSEADRAAMVEILLHYGYETRATRRRYFDIVETREKLLSWGQGGKDLKVVAAGREAWDGWVSLRRTRIEAAAIDNTARVIAALDADVLCTVEVEDRPTLCRFNETVLARIGAAASPAVAPYPHVMLIDGNDDRGIDVGIMARAPVGLMRSNVDLPGPSGWPVFSRDCAEFALPLAGGGTLWVLCNHLKSQGYGNKAENDRKRAEQARAVKAIYQRARAMSDFVAVLGDLNAPPPPANPSLAPLLEETDLREVMSHPSYAGPPGTYDTLRAGNKLDYILLSPALWERVGGVHLETRGIYAPRAVPVRFAEVTSDLVAASDHAALAVDLDLVLDPAA